MRNLNNQKKKLLIILCLLTILWIIVSPPYNLFSLFYYKIYPEKSIFCYRKKSNLLGTLPDISLISNDDINPFKPPRNKSIFFHETSCNSFINNGLITINVRQACAVESAAVLNPNYQIFLLYASPGVIKFTKNNNRISDKFKSESEQFIKVLMGYPNIHIYHVDFENYSKGTPVEDIYQSGYLETSSYAQSHASDILRYLTLWKYGGIYLDLDLIVIKSLQDLGMNFAGSESDENVAAGVISFSTNGYGKMWAEKCLNDLKNNFNGHDWGNNGPGVITRLSRELCKVPLAKDMVQKSCNGFKVLPIDYFYPIPWRNWTMYFNKSTYREVLSLSRNSYAVHVWNKHSSGLTLTKHSEGIAYLEFAKKFCPKIFNECNYF